MVGAMVSVSGGSVGGRVSGVGNVAVVGAVLDSAVVSSFPGITSLTRNTMATITTRISPRRIKSVAVGTNPPLFWRLRLLEPRRPEPLEEEPLPRPEFLEPDGPRSEDRLAVFLEPGLLSEERPVPRSGRFFLDLYSLAKV